MLKTYRYRIYPTQTQAKLIDQTFDACRLVYNLGLEIKSYAWRSQNKNISQAELQKQASILRNEYAWLRSVNSQSLYASLANLEKAFKTFFAGGGYPKFKNKRGRQSFSCHNSVRRIDWVSSRLTLPKLTDIPIRLSRKFEGIIKTVTVIRTATGKYFTNILVESSDVKISKGEISKNTTIGIDLGLKSFVISSNGHAFEPNRHFKNSLKRLQCLQRRANRKKKGSKSRKMANKKLAILHEKISNQRADYIHKVTTELIRDNQAETFVVEDLNVAGMVKNRRLSQAISDASFGEFFRQMQYKCDWYGKNLIMIDRFAPSSKRCSDCGEINDNLTLADREWACLCGAHHDRDLNAAKNIKYYGLLKHSGEGIAGEPVESSSLEGAKKQEILMSNNHK